MEQIRSFIAIELPDALKQELAKLQGKLRQPQQSWIKWVSPQAIHLTLKFLGNVSADKIPSLTKAIEASARGIPPFRLEISGVGAFPNLKRTQVVWVGMGGEIDVLRQLQHSVESHLAPLGFAPEKREFSAHLTLARVRNQATPSERERLGQLISSTRFETAHPIKVDAIDLMKSQLTREGAIYTKISSAGLDKPLSSTIA
ncbi:RNA 2',3'-cyclic phosphodiesterase [Chloroflexota bacterium]